MDTLRFSTPNLLNKHGKTNTSRFEIGLPQSSVPKPPKNVEKLIKVGLSVDYLNFRRQTLAKRMNKLIRIYI